LQVPKIFSIWQRIGFTKSFQASLAALVAGDERGSIRRTMWERPPRARICLRTLPLS
jgi:hypothetical protein